MGSTKSKILAIFLMVLFFQRVGPSLYLKTYISEHIYKEQPDHLTHTFKNGRMLSHRLVCKNNRIYEVCSHTLIQPYIPAPAQVIHYSETQFMLYEDFVHIGIFLKQSALRGPPKTC